MSKRLPQALESGKSPGCGESTGEGAGENARESLAFDCRMARSMPLEVHWYEAAGIGRKEFKIKRLL
jgi:hypothetical protein